MEFFNKQINIEITKMEDYIEKIKFDNEELSKEIDVLKGYTQIYTDMIEGGGKCLEPKKHENICAAPHIDHAPSKYNARGEYPTDPADVIKMHEAVSKKLYTFADACLTNKLVSFEQINNHLVANMKKNAGELPNINEKTFKVAVLIALFSEILFEYFNNETFGLIPGYYWRNFKNNIDGDRKYMHTLREFRNKYDRSIKVHGLSYRDVNDEFKMWSDRIIKKLIIAWSLKKEQENNISNNKLFWEILKQIWDLHTLSFSLPYTIHIIHFYSDSAVIEELCENKHNLGKLDSDTVFCTVIPGLKINNIGMVAKCDVICFNKKK